MLQSLHVKNLALIEETEVEFGPGLNILTGETGAGKSLLLGSINLALGAKFEKEMLRKGKDTALVELTFSDNSKKLREKLEEMDLEAMEDGTVIITRKMQVGKSVCRINGETVTAKQVKELAEYLIDIHGQHEHQSLLHKKNHLEILDSFCAGDFEESMEELQNAYKECKRIRQELDDQKMDDISKQKEEALARFELEEIEAAAPVIGEDEELEKRYRLMVNSKKIMDNLSEVYEYTGGQAAESAGESVSRAVRAMRNIASYDDRLQELEGQLAEIEDLLSGFNRDVADFMTDCEFDEEQFSTTEERLNELNRLKGKYGRTIEEVLQYAEQKKSYLEKLEHYDAYMEKLQKELTASEKRLKQACIKVSEIRQAEAKVLAAQLKEALIHLNFLTVEFEIAVRPNQAITGKGFDDVEFLISTNPGESLKPLSQVASGGELSRIMLAIKTVMAGRDQIDALIFDEIDAGISGKTAWCVSEQLDTAAHSHQVICITHLPQIAAMADHHFCIEKSSHEESTITNICALQEEEGLCELARLLGSDALTEAALSNAGEMRKQALLHKMNEK